MVGPPYCFPINPFFVALACVYCMRCMLYLALPCLGLLLLAMGLALPWLALACLGLPLLAFACFCLLLLALGLPWLALALFALFLLAIALRNTSENQSLAFLVSAFFHFELFLSDIHKQQLSCRRPRR